MNRSTVRKARRARACDSCRGHIGVGDHYVEHVASPYDDTTMNGDRWARMAECGACARRYGRFGRPEVVTS